VLFLLIPPISVWATWNHLAIDVARKYPGALEKQFVPTDPALWELDRFEEFLAARRALIAQAINKRMAELIAELELPKPQTLADMLTGENAALEYKTSMRWDLRTQQVNKALEKSIAKTVAGFLNSEHASHRCHGRLHRIGHRV